MVRNSDFSLPKLPKAGDGPVRAAQYLRMSTEHQKYSTENQSDEIQLYAARNDFEIVQTYTDEGKSGLRLDGRIALKQLISDVLGGRADFSTILVYDVSRWGRFQDVDQGAYLEYICRSAGILVHYCAEQFSNDGSMGTSVLKTLKRAMAGEYSRELSKKVFAGQCRLITLGFRQGGKAGYGLRRQLIDEQRHPKGELSFGEHKSIQTDRVILVPGPPPEVDTVRRMFRLFVEQRRTEREIAGILNDEGIQTDLHRPWTRGTVHQVLSNEKYIGNNVFNRVSFKLKEARVVNPPEKIVRAEAAFAPVVEKSLFEQASHIIAARSQRFTNAELLEQLAKLYAETGWLSGLVIDERDDMAGSSVYRHRFGSLLRAYELIGFSPGRDYRFIEANRFLRSMHPEIVNQTIAQIELAGGFVARDAATDLLRINDEFTASIVIARCLVLPGGGRRWKVRLDAVLQPDISVVLRMGEDNRTILDYYLLPQLDFGPSSMRMSEENGIFLDAYRTESLTSFISLAARTPIRKSA